MEASAGKGALNAGFYWERVYVEIQTEGERSACRAWRETFRRQLYTKN